MNQTLAAQYTARELLQRAANQVSKNSAPKLRVLLQMALMAAMNQDHFAALERVRKITDEINTIIGDAS